MTYLIIPYTVILCGSEVFFIIIKKTFPSWSLGMSILLGVWELGVFYTWEPDVIIGRLTSSVSASLRLLALTTKS